jgi:hypothetical protein
MVKDHISSNWWKRSYFWSKWWYLTAWLWLFRTCFIRAYNITWSTFEFLLLLLWSIKLCLCLTKLFQLPYLIYLDQVLLLLVFLLHYIPIFNQLSNLNELSVVILGQYVIDHFLRNPNIWLKQIIFVFEQGVVYFGHFEMVGAIL